MKKFMLRRRIREGNGTLSPLQKSGLLGPVRLVVHNEFVRAKNG
ncbi:hypothetical protein [Cyclobacterium sp. SYSU L10401]|nr:hypothetical protein [Cyclobacterium sp. SYSU L10401]